MRWIRFGKEREAPVQIMRDGKLLKPWQVRAGLLIVKTEYDHERGVVAATVEEHEANRADGPQPETPDPGRIYT